MLKTRKNMVFRKAPATPQDLNDNKFRKDWYFDFLSTWDKEIREKKSDGDTQLRYLDELSKRVEANLDGHNLRLLNEKEIKLFWQGVKRNLENINDSAIINSEGHFSSYLKHFLLELKNGKRLAFTYQPADIVLKTSSGMIFTQASSSPTSVEMMSYDKTTNSLTIIGTLTFPFDEKASKLVVSIHGRRKELKDSGIYSDIKVFGKTVYHKFPFRFEISLKTIPQPIDICFSLESSDNLTKVPLSIEFNAPMSKLAGRLSYWRFNRYVATHNKKTIHIKNNSSIKTAIREVVFLLAIGTVWRRPRTAILRTLYWFTRPVLGRRNIWLYADKIYKAGDNAEWLYRYAIKQPGNMHHYYVLQENSADAKRFERDGLRYLKYKSILQRLLFLHAKILVFTHSNAPAYYRYGGNNEMYFRGLYNYDVMYIQHGLLVQDMAWLYNKSHDDFKQIFVASKFERANLLRPDYGYKPSEIVSAGAARYDDLIDRSKKNILISPTWRTYIASPTKDIGESRGRDENFRDTDYYKIYMSLVRHKKLTAVGKRLGFDITLLLHPALAAQAKDFEQDGFVKIVAVNDGFDYHQALTRASLFVTDYSGIQFDFAYMYKPILYFHPPALPPSYDEASYKYKAHALGEITTELDELVQLICEYMENNCELKQKYKQRIDNFFYYHDRNNSRRIYDSIVSWENKRI